MDSLWFDQAHYAMAVERRPEAGAEPDVLEL